MDKELIAEVVIEKYVRSVVISESRRATYYRKGEKIPKKYEDKLGIDYYWRPVDGKQGIYLVDDEEDPIIKNPKTAGTKKEKLINGQHLHQLTMATYERKRVIDTIKKQFKPLIDRIEIIKNFPIKIRFDFYNNEKGYDIDNHSLWYTKVFFDCLTELGKIPDDNIEFVQSFACNYIFSENRKLIVKIFGTLIKI